MSASYCELRLRCLASQLQSVFFEPCAPKLEMTLLPSARMVRLTCPWARVAQRKSRLTAKRTRIGIDGSRIVRMSFAPIQKEVDHYISQFKEGYFPPLEMLARLTEELGELARALSYHTGFKKLKSGEKADDVADELCDVIFVAVCLANSLNIDLDQAFATAMNKYRVRDRDRWTRK